VDALVVELALTRGPASLQLAAGAFCSTLDEFRTVLPRARAVPLLVDALRDADDLYDLGMQELASEAPRRSGALARSRGSGAAISVA
jgi:hypothetical protein